MDKMRLKISKNRTLTRFNKKGISHIEIMLSFLIFVGFVIFALYFFSPAKTSRLVDSSLTYTFREIKEDVLVEVEKFSVALDLSGLDEEDLDKKIKIKMFESSTEIFAKVTDRDGNPIESATEGNSGHVRFRASDSVEGDSTKGFVNVELSEDFIDGGLTCAGGCLNNVIDITVVSSEKFKYISYNEMDIISQRYASEYEILRAEFNLPDRVNFDFSLKFKDVDNNIEVFGKIPEGVEIYSDVERVEVLMVDGRVEFADLIVRIW